MRSIKLRTLGRLEIIIPVAIAAACSADPGGEKKFNGGNGASGGNGGSAGIGIGGTGIGAAPGGGATGSGKALPTCTTNCTDFPERPILGDGVPAGAPDMFGALDPAKFTGPAPCVLEPHLSSGNTPGALMPANWLAPRFRFTAPGDLFEIRVHSEVQAHDLVAYTKTPLWSVPMDIWKPASNNNAGKPMKITIRSISSAGGGAQSGIQGDINIAPVNAGGSMVFWTVKDSNVGPESSKLYGFSVGETGVGELLAPKKVQFTGILHEGGAELRGEYGGGKPGFAAGEVQCIGCHTSTPDGKAVIFTDDWPWNKAIASVEGNTAGQIPAYVTPGGRALLKMPFLGTQTTSPAHWGPGKKILIASYGTRTTPFSGGVSGENDRLLWMNLETTAAISDVVPPNTGNERQLAKDARNAAITSSKDQAWGTLTMDGETGSAVTPDFNNAGDTIVYVSTDDSPNGHTSYDAMRADLFTVPYNDGKGGAVKPVSGATDPNYYEYYPSFSADSKFIAFTRAPRKAPPSAPDGPYYNRFGEIGIIPSAGGAAHKVLANEPVACAGDNLGAGLLNSWPKWSPHAHSEAGKTYYFLIFSSARKYPGSFEIPRGQYTPPTLDTRSSQLYMAAVVVDDASGAITSYPAVYLWNQNRVIAGTTVTEVQNSNLTPAWDEFLIPPVIEPPR